MQPRRHLIALLASFAAWVNCCPGQESIDFDWITHFQGSGLNDWSRWVAVDRAGQCYVTGEFSGSLRVGGEAITSRGRLDMFLAKLGADGRVIWLRQGGGEEDDRGYRLEVDATGNCYISGSYGSGDFTMGGVPLALTGKRGAYLAKLNSDGKTLWVRSAESTEDAYGFGVTVDRKGNCYWTGGVTGRAKFGPISIGGSKTVYFLASFDSDGIVRWVRSAGGSGQNGGRGLAIDSGGNILATGFITGRTNFDGQFLGFDNKRNVFVAKYDSSGKLIWAHDGGGHSDAIGQAIGSDAGGNVYVTGMFGGTPVFGRQILKSAGGEDVFLTKYDPSGGVIWAQRAGGPGKDHALALAVRPSGEVVITGDYAMEPEFGGIRLANQGRSEVFVAQYRTNGGLDWVRTNGGPATNVCYAIALAPDGSLINAIAFGEVTAFGDRQLTSVAGVDVVVGKMKAIPSRAILSK